MEKLNRGDKIYLDTNNTIESLVNKYLDCRDGSVELYEYVDFSGFGSQTRLFLCHNHKHETVAIVRQTLVSNKWIEDVLAFDSDSFEILKALVNGNKQSDYGKYYLVRD